MDRRRFAKALIGGFAGAASVAWACTDIGCSPVWNLGASESACANWGVLTPGNDSRVNLFHL